jgi:hypothetical protein
VPSYSNVRRLPSGRWQGRYLGPDGKSHPKRFSTATAAAEWVNEQTESIRVSTWCNPDDGKIRLGEWAPTWTKARINLRHSTRARDESYVRNQRRPHAGKSSAC